MTFFAPIGWSGGQQLSYIGAAGVSTTGSLVVPFPSGVQAGDLIVAGGQAQTGTPAAPSGWTQLFSNTTVRDAVGVCKVINATDVSTGSVDLGGSDAVDGVCMAFRPSKAISSVTPAGWASEGTASEPTSQTVTSGSGTIPLVVIGFAISSTSTAVFSTQSPAFTYEASNTDDDAHMGCKIYNSTPSNHDIDMDDLGVNNVLASGYIQIT